ncbi:MAG: P-loop NTPase family protein [Acidimicrobiales bacterium]
MSAVALGSVKASPGVTTAAVALGASWPAGRQVTVVEADPAGGDLAARYGLAAEPSLLTVAAASRNQPAPDLAGRHLQHLPGGLAVLVAPASAEQTQAALGMLGSTGALFSGVDDDVLVDAGRLDPRSAALGLVGSCELLVVCARPVLAELHHLAARIEALRQAAVQLGVVLVGAGPYRAAEVTEALEVEVLGALPDDPGGAALLAGHAATSRALGRLALLRGARSLAEAICARLAPGAPPHPEKPSSGAGEEAGDADATTTEGAEAASAPDRAARR